MDFIQPGPYVSSTSRPECEEKNAGKFASRAQTKRANFLHFTHYDFTAISCISISLRKSLTMETNNDIEDMEEEEEFGFSRNYFLAKELGSSGKKSARKLSEINLVDEQVLALKL